MWNYSFAVPSMFIITIILVFYFTLPRLSLRMNRTFLNILVVEGAVIFLDIVSSWADENYQEVAVGTLYLLNALYFVFFFARAYVFFVYTANVFRLDPLKRALQTSLIRLPFIVSSVIALSCPWSGLIFSIQEDGYHSGPLYDLVYIIFFRYLAFSFFIIFAYRRYVTRRRHWYSILLANIALLAGITARRMYPRLLLMDTFCIMAVIILYLAFQNPEFYLELRGAIFNATAFRDYIDENNGRLHNKAIGLVVHNYHEMRDIYGGRQIDKGITLISNYLIQTFPEQNIFYYRKGRFIILGDKNMSFQESISTLSKRFDQPWTADDLELYLEVGFVTADFDNKVESADALLNTLIIAMDRADKLNTREPVVVSDNEFESNEKETTLKRLLDKVIAEDSVEVFLQPIINAKDGSLVGAEALSRIRDVDGRLIPPIAFIHIAERNGRINILGEQVFEKACRFIRDNDMEKMGLSWINVNLSPMQFMKADLAERYDSIVKKYGISPDKVHLEITEESMVDESFLRKQIQSMQSKGFMFVLDDYGTGYSNLTRLKKCPFINIKLDMSLVWDFFNEPDEILPNMIQAFKHMNFSVTAEGIEDERMAKVMSDIGCDFHQGYHYSKPLPMKEFVEKYG